MNLSFNGREIDAIIKEDPKGELAALYTKIQKEVTSYFVDLDNKKVPVDFTALPERIRTVEQGSKSALKNNRRVPKINLHPSISILSTQNWTIEYDNEVFNYEVSLHTGAKQKNPKTDQVKYVPKRVDFKKHKTFDVKTDYKELFWWMFVSPVSARLEDACPLSKYQGLENATYPNHYLLVDTPQQYVEQKNKLKYQAAITEYIVNGKSNDVRAMAVYFGNTKAYEKATSRDSVNLSLTGVDVKEAFDIINKDVKIGLIVNAKVAIANGNISIMDYRKQKVIAWTKAGAIEETIAKHKGGNIVDEIVDTLSGLKEESFAKKCKEMTGFSYTD